MKRRSYSRARRRTSEIMRRRPSYRRRRGGKLLGGLNIKNSLVGAAGLLAVKMVRPHLIELGNYNAPVESIATGAVLKIAGMDNADLISAGIKLGIAQLGKDLLSGRGFGVGGNASEAGV